MRIMNSLILTMTAIVVVILGFIFCATALAKDSRYPGAVNVPHLLDSISGAENTPQWQIGPNGERSVYQMMQYVWETHSELPFEFASRTDNASTERAWIVAHRHIDWIRARLHHLGLEDNVYNIALVWHAGYGRCMAKRIRQEDRDYAQRVLNIYNDK